MTIGSLSDWKEDFYERKDAMKVSDGVWSIVDLSGGDAGYEWLDGWQGPIGDSWRDFFSSGASSKMEFYDYLAQNVAPRVLAQYAANVNDWVNDAKFDLD